MVAKRCWTIFLTGVALFGMACWPAFASDILAIKANTGQKRVLLMPNMPLNVTIKLDPGIYAGTPADWWLIAETAAGDFHFSPTGSWLPGRAVSYQGPLFEFPDTGVLNATGLPPGTYKIKFALDPIVDGIMANVAIMDEVEVTVAEFSCPESPNDSLAALSSVQQSFISTRGNPDIFTLGFSSEELDANGQLVYSNNVRRVESWAYNGSELATAVFDNGYFIKETRQEAVSPLQPTPFSPSQFTHCMNQNDVVALMGEPSCILSEVMGGRTYQYLRYNPTQDRAAATVVLENGLLITVSAGFSMAYPDFSDQCSFD